MTSARQLQPAQPGDGDDCAEPKDAELVAHDPAAAARPQETGRMLQTLLGNIAGMVYRCRDDADWTMEFVSESCFRITGYQPGDLLLNGRVSYEEITHPEDRDRVLHSRAFRRLEYKTQVFVHHEGDHYRNRLTHTLEGAQIARTVARALRLNEDLAEAIVLAHDLGHTPFGHAGERVLNELLAEDGGFDHNRQSLRIVDLLEERDPGYRGLNLTHETREGILKHGAGFEHPVALPKASPHPSLEARVADFSDEIAYTNHDLDDGLRSGLLSWEQLEEVALWRERAIRCRTTSVSEVD